MKILFATSLFIFTLIVNAQDVIYFRSGAQQEAIVKKVGVSTIEYVRYDNQAGAMYEVLKSDVYKIRYQNGVEDVFKTPDLDDINMTLKHDKYGQFIDERDSNEYRTVVIGDQTWMAENLKFNINLGTNVGGDCADCCIFYTFDDAAIACPKGWHLPTDPEWMALEIYLGMYESEASTIGWRGTRPGQAKHLLRNGDSGLELFLCGRISVWYDEVQDLKNNYKGLNKEGYYWTASEKSKNQAYYRLFGGRKSIYRYYFSKDNSLPVRCVKD